MVIYFRSLKCISLSTSQEQLRFIAIMVKYYSDFFYWVSWPLESRMMQFYTFDRFHIGVCLWEWDQICSHWWKHTSKGKERSCWFFPFGSRGAASDPAHPPLHFCCISLTFPIPCLITPKFGLMFIHFIPFIFKKGEGCNNWNYCWWCWLRLLVCSECYFCGAPKISFSIASGP